MRWLNLFLALPASILLSACIDTSDYELDEVALSPSLALPLVQGEVSIRDLIGDDNAANVKIDSDGLVYLSYEEELISQGIEELFDIPDLSLNRSFIMPGGVLPPTNRSVRTDSLTQEIDLNLSPEQLDELGLKQGQLSFSTSVVPANPQLDYEINVSLPGFVNRNTNQSINLAARGNGNFNLSDYTVALNDNKFTLKLVLVIRSHANPITVAPGTSVNIQLQFRSLDFRYIRGFFGFQTASLPAETIDMDVFENAFGEAEVSLAAPKLELTVVNEYGVPVLVDFLELEARKAGGSLAVLTNPVNPVLLTSPGVLGESAATAINIVNVKELLDFAPSQFYYRSEARINEGVNSGVNFLADTSKLKVRMNVEVPLYGHASNITVRDTVEVDWSDVDQSQIDNASFKIKLINQLPLDGTVQFFLTDARYNVIGTLLNENQTNIITGSTVNANGELQAAGIYDQSIELDKEKIDNIFRAKYLVVAAVFSTSRGAAGNLPDVKFKADYTLSVTAGVLANLKLNVSL